MQQKDRIYLKILLPFGIHTERSGVLRMVVESKSGSFGILPHRLDCVAAIVPGILIFEVEGQGETYIAVDEGILIKAGLAVTVSVRNAVAGIDLSTLRKMVDQEFMNLNEHEKKVSSVLAKLESGFIRRLEEFHNE